jgi:hypothetical protein
MLRSLYQMKDGLTVDASRDTSLMRVLSVSATDPSTALSLTTREREALANVAHSGIGKLNGIHASILNVAADRLISFRLNQKQELHDALLKFLEKQAIYTKDMRPAFLGGPKGSRNMLARQATWELVEYLASISGKPDLLSAVLQTGKIIRQAGYPEEAMLDYLAASEFEALFPVEWLSDEYINPVDLYGSGYYLKYKDFNITTKTEGLMLNLLCGVNLSDSKSRLTADGGILNRPQFNLPRIVKGSHSCADLRASVAPNINLGVMLGGQKNSPFVAAFKNLIPELNPQRLTTVLEQGPASIELLFSQWYTKEIEPKLQNELETMFVRYLREIFNKAWKDKSTDSFSRPSNNPGLIAWKTGNFTQVSSQKMFLADRKTPNGIRASFAEQIETAIRSFAVYAYRAGLVKAGTPESTKFQSLLIRNFQYRLMTPDDLSRAEADVLQYLAEKSAPSKISEQEELDIAMNCAASDMETQACIRDAMAARSNSTDYGFLKNLDTSYRLVAIQAMLESDLTEIFNKNSADTFGFWSILYRPISQMNGENAIVNQMVNSRALDFARASSTLSN